MNFLKNKRFYLSAPIENSNLGIGWRIPVSKILVERYGIDLFDPFLDPKQQQSERLKLAQQNKDHEEMTRIAKSFVKKDLGQVDRSDAIIAYLPAGVPTTGCHHEIINSNNSKKPTLLVCDRPNKYYLPLWYYGFIPFEFMFSSWEELYSYLDKVNNGQVENSKWDFICGKL